MDPPFYILFSTLPASSSSLAHPTIQYHYADDSPLALLPQHPDEHVLLLDHNPSNPQASVVTSTSKTFVVNRIKVEEAPGAAVAEDKRNDRMYIVEATGVPGSGEDKLALTPERPSPHSVIAQFKQRKTLQKFGYSPSPQFGRAPGIINEQGLLDYLRRIGCGPSPEV